MSYSFNVGAVDKDTAKIFVAAEVDKIIEQQPIHSLDREAIMANALHVIDLTRALTGDENLSVSIDGYVSTNADGEASVVSVSATASVVRRPPA